MASISQSELIEALVTASTAPADAKTLKELQAMHGLAPGRVRSALAAFKDAGRLQAHRVYREGIDGRNAAVAAYTITPAKKGKRA